MRLQWAPLREEDFDGGSCFDAFVELWTATSTGFVGVETMYAEGLAASQITGQHGWKWLRRSPLEDPPHVRDVPRG